MLIEILEDLDYETWNKQSLELNSFVDKMGDIVNKIAKTDPDRQGGLVSDKVTGSAKYRKAKKDYDVAFRKLQNFNKNSSKAFQRRQSKEHRANRMMGK